MGASLGQHTTFGAQGKRMNLLQRVLLQLDLVVGEHTKAEIAG